MHWPIVVHAGAGVSSDAGAPMRTLDLPQTHGNVALRWYFVAVAREAHAARTAARVSVAEPTVSAQIRRLERLLGRRCFTAINARRG
jgi:hypothetical protein